LFSPFATLFKSAERAIKLDIKRTFSERDQALCFVLDAGKATVNARLKGKKLDFALLAGES